MIKLTASVENKLIKVAAETGKTPNTIVKNALEIYLEELEDARDIKARKGEKTISVKELGKRIGL